jgi:thiol-disulfide isomerase/thioredoxin
MVIIILAMIIPGTRKPIAIFVNKILSFSPSVTSEEERAQIASYAWVLEKYNKDRIEFSDHKGKVVLINFWATWCPPCIAEMPSFQKLYEDYKDRVDFFFVSNEDHQTVRNFMDRKNFTLPTYRPKSDIPEPLDDKTYPTTYLLDKQGNIVIEKVGSAAWDSERMRKTLDDLLSK